MKIATYILSQTLVIGSCECTCSVLVNVWRLVWSAGCLGALTNIISHLVWVVRDCIWLQLSFLGIQMLILLVRGVFLLLFWFSVYRVFVFGVIVLCLWVVVSFVHVVLLVFDRLSAWLLWVIDGSDFWIRAWSLFIVITSFPWQRFVFVVYVLAWGLFEATEYVHSEDVCIWVWTEMAIA